MNVSRPDVYQMLVVLEEWKLKYHSENDNIIFQNKAMMSNVIFTKESLSIISKNSKGFENIPTTIENPSEIWATKGKRNYITFGNKYSYVVQTENSKIVKAFLTTSVNKYRSGVWLT